MSLAINGLTQQGVWPGQPGKKYQSGNFTFNSTDANGELKVNMHQVETVLITPIGAPATDEHVYCDEATLAKEGRIIVPATGSITIARTGASKTSGLKCSYLVIGV